MNGVPLCICSIPCEADKAFKVVVKIPKKECKRENHSIELYIDGRWVRFMGQFLPRDPSADSDETLFLEREILCNGSSRRFKFGPLIYTDDESLLGKEGIELGTIKVKINLYAKTQKIREVKATEKAKETSANQAPQVEDRIHESSKKGLTHCVKFGEEEPNKRWKGRTPGYEVDVIDENELCEFHFSYRSMDILIANGVVPRSDAPQAPVTSQVDPAVMSSATAVRQPVPNAVSLQPSAEAGTAPAPTTVSPASHTTLAFTNPETRNEDIMQVKHELEENACLSLGESTTSSRNASRTPEGEGSPPIDEDGDLEYLTPEPAPEPVLLQDAALETVLFKVPTKVWAWKKGRKRGGRVWRTGKRKGMHPLWRIPQGATLLGGEAGVLHSLPPAQSVECPTTSPQPIAGSGTPAQPRAVSSHPPMAVEVIEISSDEDDETELQHWDNQAKMCERELVLMRELRIAKSNAHKIRARAQDKKRKRQGEAGQAPKKVCVAEGVVKKEEEDPNEPRLD